MTVRNRTAAPAARVPRLGRFLFVCAAATLAVPEANAGYWTVDGRLGQRFEAESNFDLDPVQDNPLMTVTFDADMTMEAINKRSVLRLTAGAGVTYFAGDGAPDTPIQFDPRLGAAYEFRGKTYSLEGSVSASLAPTLFTQLDDSGIVDSESQQFTFLADFGFTRQLDERNDVNLSLFGSLIDFIDASPRLVPTRTVGLSVGWDHQINETTTFSLTPGIRHFIADDGSDTRSQTFDFIAGFTRQQTPRHFASVQAGASAVREEAVGAGTDFTVSGNGALSFNYSLADLSTGFSLSQSVDPSSIGELQSFTRFTTFFNYDISAGQSVGVDLGYLRRTPLSGAGSDFESFNVGPRYSFQITEDADLVIGYRFRMEEDGAAGVGTGHQLFLTFEQNLDLLR